MRTMIVTSLYFVLKRFIKASQRPQDD